MYGSQTPIDVHYSKLIDWLVQHRHCKRDWGENLAAIRRKIRVALKDMPENEEIKQILIGSKLDYFKSMQVVEVLKTTEASSKNIFGFYSSQRMKDWQDIVHSYERDCLYIAEVATDLIRQTNYEIPRIKAVIKALSRQKEDLIKDRASLLRRAQQFNNDRLKLAQSYNVKGDDVALELEENSKIIPSVVREVADLTKGLGLALDYYRDFAKSTCEIDASSIGQKLSCIALGDAQQVFEDTNARNEFVNNLYELGAFFQMLTDELPPKLDADKILSTIKQIQSIVDRKDVRILFLMRDSSALLTNLQEKLDNLSVQAQNCEILAEQRDEEEEELDKQIKDTEQHLRDSISAAKNMQHKVEKSLRDLYKDRPFNIMGCIG